MAITAEELRKGVSEYRKKKQENKITVEELRKGVAEYKKHRLIDTSKVDQAYIDSFVNDSNNFFTKKSGSDIYDKDTYTTAQDLASRAVVMGAWLRNNKKSNIPQETYTGLNDLINNLQTINSDFTKQWATADDYTKWYNDRAASLADYNTKLNYDLTVGKAEIDKLNNNVTAHWNSV
jgi:hypothetical protein